MGSKAKSSYWNKIDTFLELNLSSHIASLKSKLISNSIPIEIILLGVVKSSLLMAVIYERFKVFLSHCSRIFKDSINLSYLLNSII